MQAFSLKSGKRRLRHAPEGSAREHAAPWATLALIGVLVALAHVVILGAMRQLKAPVLIAAAAPISLRSMQAPSAQTASMKLPEPADLLPAATAAPIPIPIPVPDQRPPGRPETAPVSTVVSAVHAQLGAEPSAALSVAMPSSPLPPATRVDASAAAEAVVSAAASARPVLDDAQAPIHATIPAPTRLSYNITANKFPYSAQAELLWQHDGTSYTAQFEIRKILVVRSQSSTGQVAPEGLAPTRFGDKTRSELAAHFDRERGRITFSANTPDAALRTGAQDRLSLLVQLAAMVAGEPQRYPDTSSIALQVVGAREADTWLFTVEAWQTLELGGTLTRVLKLARNPRQPYDQRVEIWLAPALDYLPARVRITDANGDYVDQQWRATAPP